MSPATKPPVRLAAGVKIKEKAQTGRIGTLKNALGNKVWKGKFDGNRNRKKEIKCHQN